jgi:cell division transport system permease protein
MISVRRSRSDELGLRRAVADRMVPFLIAALAFVASLAIAGWTGATVLAGYWDRGAGSLRIVQVPAPAEPDATGARTRLSAVQALLAATPGVESVNTLSDDYVNSLLRPWLETDIKTLSVPVPAVISLHMTGKVEDLTGLEAQLARTAPDSVLEDIAGWADRLRMLARLLQLCSGFVLLIVALATAVAIAVAARSGFAARRSTIMIVYQLGATDGYIAHQFAHRAATLAMIGGLIGGLFALPVILTLTTVAAAIDGRSAPHLSTASLSFLPPRLWLLPAILPAAAAAIGYLTTQVTMRRWLRQIS